MAEAAVDNPVIVNMSGSAQYYLKYLPFLYLVRPDVYAMFDHVHNMWSAGAGISRLGRSMVLLDPTLRNESHKMVLLGSNFDSKSQSKSPILTFPSPDDKVKIKCMLKLKCESQRSSGFYKLQVIIVISTVLSSQNIVKHDYMSGDTACRDQHVAGVWWRDLAASVNLFTTSRPFTTLIRTLSLVCNATNIQRHSNNTSFLILRLRHSSPFIFIEVSSLSSEDFKFWVLNIVCMSTKPPMN